MKVAVCLSGHSRNLLQYTENFSKFIIDPYKPDIFLSLWETDGWRLEGPLTKHDPDYKGFDFFTSQTDFDLLCKYLKPKKVIYEKWGEMEKFFMEKSLEIAHLAPPPHHRPSNVLSMYYKIKNCNQLKCEFEEENNFKYDVVIRTRADTVYQRELLTTNLLKWIKDGYIITPSEFSYNGTGDIITIGNSEVIDIFSSLFDNIPNLADRQIDMNPHVVLKHFLAQKLGSKHIQIPLNVNINRCRYNCLTSEQLENGVMAGLECPVCSTSVPYTRPKPFKQTVKVAFVFIGDVHLFLRTRKWWIENGVNKTNSKVFINLYKKTIPLNPDSFPSLDPNSKNSSLIDQFKNKELVNSKAVSIELQEYSVLIEKARTYLAQTIGEPSEELINELIGSFQKLDGLGQVLKYESQMGEKFDLVLVVDSNTILGSTPDFSEFLSLKKQFLVDENCELGHIDSLLDYYSKITNASTIVRFSNLKKSKCYGLINDMLNVKITGQHFGVELFGPANSVIITLKNKRIGSYTQYGPGSTRRNFFKTRKDIKSFSTIGYKFKKKQVLEETNYLAGRLQNFGTVRMDEIENDQREVREPVSHEVTIKNRLKKVIPPKSKIE